MRSHISQIPFPSGAPILLLTYTFTYQHRLFDLSIETNQANLTRKESVLQSRLSNHHPGRPETVIPELWNLEDLLLCSHSTVLSPKSGPSKLVRQSSNRSRDTTAFVLSPTFSTSSPPTTNHNSSAQLSSAHPPPLKLI